MFSSKYITLLQYFTYAMVFAGKFVPIQVILLKAFRIPVWREVPLCAFSTFIIVNIHGRPGMRVFTAIFEVLAYIHMG
jgi:hypothetical protein